MQALIKMTAGPGAELRDVPIPQVGPHDLLVRVEAAAICGTDMHIINWTPFCEGRVRPPMIFGHEIAGQVMEVGEKVEHFQVGDRVAADTHVPCGTCFQCTTGRQHTCEHMVVLGVHVGGAFSEYFALPEACAWRLPEEISYEVGACLEPLGVATHAVLAEDVSARSVVVLGCGPIGLLALSVAEACGASLLFAVEVNPWRLAMAHEFAPSAILLNPAEQDMVAEVLRETGGRGADVCVELTGAPAAIGQAFAVLRRGGRVTLCGLPAQPVEIDLANSIIYKEARVLGTTGRVMWDTWWQVSDLVSRGKVPLEKVITHRYPLSDWEEAFAVSISGKAAKVLLFPGK